MPVTLQKIADLIKKNIRENYDVAAAATGREGSGKTTLLVQLAMKVDPSFTIKERLSYEAEQVMPKFFKVPKGCAFVIDEAMNVAYKRDSMKRLNKAIIKILAQCRQRNLFLGFAIPRIGDLDENLRNHRIRLWLKVLKRGVAEIYFQDKRVESGDPWHLGSDKKAYKLRRKRCFKGRFKFDDLPDDLKIEYAPIKEEAYKRLETEMQELMKSELSQQKKPSDMILTGQLAYAINKKLGITYSRLSDISNIDESTLKVYSKRYRDLNDIKV